MSVCVCVGEGGGGAWLSAWAVARACARVALLIQHATDHHIPCGLWFQHIFWHYLINGTIFGKKKVTEHKICIFIVSATFTRKISHSKKH
jgi:hypothetical protein